MAEVQELIPGARRALFRRYHLGGCSSCAFSPDETLEQLSARNEIQIAELIDHLQSSHEQDLALLISAGEVQSWLAEKKNFLLLDVRSREEFEAVKIDGAQFLSQETVQTLMTGDRTIPVVFVDHEGKHALDTAAYFQGHGFTQVHCLRGGIDAWALEVDPAMPRYKIER
jgi:rhodanese-related sulfurtransferase